MVKQKWEVWRRTEVGLSGVALAKTEGRVGLVGFAGFGGDPRTIRSHLHFVGALAVARHGWPGGLSIRFLGAFV